VLNISCTHHHNNFRTQPTSFKIAFLGNEIKVFTRKPPVIELGEGFLDKNLTKKVLENRLFLSEAAKSNPKNTQLIFATHETTLLDNSLFRKDQIWFT